LPIGVLDSFRIRHSNFRRLMSKGQNPPPSRVSVSGTFHWSVNRADIRTLREFPA
jgi:hypothetical protein